LISIAAIFLIVKCIKGWWRWNITLRMGYYPLLYTSVLLLCSGVRVFHRGTVLFPFSAKVSQTPNLVIHSSISIMIRTSPGHVLTVPFFLFYVVPSIFRGCSRSVRPSVLRIERLL